MTNCEASHLPQHGEPQAGMLPASLRPLLCRPYAPTHLVKISMAMFVSLNPRKLEWNMNC
jgi:hypothetical protein